MDADQKTGKCTDGPAVGAQELVGVEGMAPQPRLGHAEAQLLLVVCACFNVMSLGELIYACTYIQKTNDEPASN
jgi:hypothetical protein